MNFSNTGFFCLSISIIYCLRVCARSFLFLMDSFSHLECCSLQVSSQAPFCILKMILRMLGIVASFRYKFLHAIEFCNFKNYGMSCRLLGFSDGYACRKSYVLAYRSWV